MATYDTPLGVPGLVSFTHFDEVEAALGLATEDRRFRAVVWTADLRPVLQQFEDMLAYVRRCASNDPEAYALLQRIDPRNA